jgi:hypothetical protein
MIISHVREIPKEVPRGSAERALRKLEPQDRRVLILVVSTLEALQNCEYPASLALSVELMMAATLQLQRTSIAQAQMHGLLLPPPQMTSFICSLMVHFNKNPQGIKAALGGQVRTSCESTPAEVGNDGNKRHSQMNSELQEAKKVAEIYLKRLLKRWTSLVSVGQVSSCTLTSQNSFE